MGCQEIGGSCVVSTTNLREDHVSCSSFIGRQGIEDLDEFGKLGVSSELDVDDLDPRAAHVRGAQQVNTLPGAGIATVLAIPASLLGILGQTRRC